MSFFCSITHFGTSAKYLQALQDAKVHPSKHHSSMIGTILLTCFL